MVKKNAKKSAPPELKSVEELESQGEQELQDKENLLETNADAILGGFVKDEPEFQPDNDGLGDDSAPITAKEIDDAYFGDVKPDDAVDPDNLIDSLVGDVIDIVEKNVKITNNNLAADLKERKANDKVDASAATKYIDVGYGNFGEPIAEKKISDLPDAMGADGNEVDYSARANDIAKSVLEKAGILSEYGINDAMLGTNAPLNDAPSHDKDGNETKAGAFRRLGKQRTDLAVSSIQKIGRLAAPGAYNYSNEQVATILTALYEASHFRWVCNEADLEPSWVIRMYKEGKVIRAEKKIWLVK